MRKAKYITISEQIEKAIADNVYQGQLPGLYKLAENHKTTHITISKALRLLEEKGLVSVNGTRGTFISENSNFRKHRVIGVIGFNGDEKELEAIEKVASEFRYHTVALGFNSSLRQLLQDSPEFLFKFPADGYIIAQSFLTSKLATVLRSNGITFISTNRIIKPVGVSWTDYHAEGNLLKIINKIKSYDHRRIAYVEFTNLKYQYSKRVHKAYQKIMHLSDGFSKEYFFSPGTQEEYLQHHSSDYYSRFAEDAVKWLLGLKQRPTAVVVLSITVADFMIENLKKVGIAVPEDMSIVTYHERGENKKHLAGLHLDFVERATQASRILLNQIKYQKCSVVQKFIRGKFIDGPSLTWAPVDNTAVSDNINITALTKRRKAKTTNTIAKVVLTN